VDAHGRY
jgi:predicted phage tail protein